MRSELSIFHEYVHHFPRPEACQKSNVEKKSSYQSLGIVFRQQIGIIKYLNVFGCDNNMRLISDTHCLQLTNFVIDDLHENSLDIFEQRACHDFDLVIPLVL